MIESIIHNPLESVHQTNKPNHLKTANILRVIQDLFTSQQQSSPGTTKWKSFIYCTAKVSSQLNLIPSDLGTPFACWGVRIHWRAWQFKHRLAFIQHRMAGRNIPRLCRPILNAQLWIALGVFAGAFCTTAHLIWSTPKIVKCKRLFFCVFE